LQHPDIKFGTYATIGNDDPIALYHDDLDFSIESKLQLQLSSHYFNIIGNIRLEKTRKTVPMLNSAYSLDASEVRGFTKIRLHRSYLTMMDYGFSSNNRPDIFYVPEELYL
jgi:hypothetical protein